MNSHNSSLQGIWAAFFDPIDIVFQSTIIDDHKNETNWRLKALVDAGADIKAEDRYYRDAAMWGSAYKVSGEMKNFIRDAIATQKFGDVPRTIKKKIGDVLTFLELDFLEYEFSGVARTFEEIFKSEL